MKKNRLFAVACSAVLLFGCFGLYGCNGGGELPEQETPPTPSETEGLDYSMIYRYTPEKSPALDGKAVYKASYGYTLASEQGYNGWYYRYEKEGSEGEMTYSDGAWAGGGAKIADGILSAGTGKAVRLFVAPVAGKARIMGNPRLASEGTAAVKVFVGAEQISSYELREGAGVWDEHEVDLKAGDEVRFVAEGTADVYWNPAVDYLFNEEGSLHYTADGYFGDVHPFYDTESGKLYVYYLSTGRQSGQRREQYRSLLSTSRDFIHFEDTEIYRDEVSPPEMDLYFVLNVYRDGEGVYRSSFGSSGYAGASKSTDLIHWSNGAVPYVDDADGLLKYSHRAYFSGGAVSGRDPDVFYDAETNRLYCVVINYYSAAGASGEKHLALYISDENGRFGEGTKALDFTGKGDPECPQIKKIGNRWYLFYSEFGTGTAGNVGRFTYRVGDEGKAPDEVDWNSKPENFIDGSDLHAAQLFSVGEKYYLYGWINYSAERSVWGGYLNLPREVYQRADGTLASRCDEYLTGLLDMGEMARFDADSTLDGMTAEGELLRVTRAGGTASLARTFGRHILYADVALGGDDTRSGFLLSAGEGDVFVGVAREGAGAVLRVGSRSYTIPLRDSYRLKVISDGNFIEAFVDDEFSLTSNTVLAGAYTVKATGDKQCTISNARICKLADPDSVFD